MIDNFNSLLEQCKKRKHKYLLKVVFRTFLILFLIASIAVIYYMFYYPTTQPAPTPIVSTPVSAPVPEVNTTSLPENIPETNLTSQFETLPVAKPAAVKPIISKQASGAPLTPTTPPVQTSSVKPKTSLFEVNSIVSTPDTLAVAYQKSPNYETALMIARDYFKQKNYEQSAIWAKKANALNREAEEAWILYAKSYYAQGHKDEAIGVLELYLNYKDSKTANELMKSWKTTP